MADARVRYKGADRSLEVRLIHTWHRGDLELANCPIMSASSGLKEMMKNDVWTILNADKAIDAVSMVRASGPPFYIIRKGRQYFDVGREELDVVPLNGGRPRPRG